MTLFRVDTCEAGTISQNYNRRSPVYRIRYLLLHPVSSNEILYKITIANLQRLSVQGFCMRYHSPLAEPENN
jgi:hypothetical protein